MKLELLKKMTKNGKFFSVKFIKRTDGTMRTMLARTGVQPTEESLPKYERNWDPDDKGLLRVWDVHKKAYRHIPAENILEISAGGHRLTQGLSMDGGRVT